MEILQLLRIFKIIPIKFFFLFLLYIVSIFNATAQIKKIDLQSIWENPENTDTIRFNAIRRYYEENTLSQPDSVIQVTDYHYGLAESKKNSGEKIKALSEKSYAYFIKDNARKAEELIKEAIKIQTTLNDKIGLAGLYANLASIYRAQSKFVETIRYYNYSLRIFEENKEEQTEAAILGNLGLVYFDIKNYEIALDYFKRSLSIYKKLKLQDRIGYISLYMGGSDFEKGNYQAAIEQAEKALNIFIENSNSYVSTDCYTLLAKSYQKTKQIDKSIFNVNKSLEISEKLENTTKVIQNKILLAELNYDSDITKATQICEEVLKIIDSTSDKNSKASLYNLLYQCYKKANKIELSYKMYENYIVYNDSIVKEQSNLALIKEAVNQEFKLELLKNKQSFDQAEKRLKRNQLIKVAIIISISILIVFSVYHYFQRRNMVYLKKSEQLLEEVNRLKAANMASSVLSSSEFQLQREKIEQAIQRKLNETDWTVLNILLKEPEMSNKQIAEKAYLSVDGIGSSLRRMYFYFDIKESKYKKISLITEAIKISAA